VVNSSGAVVATLVNDVLSTGEYTLEFPTTLLGSGAYFVRIRCADYSDSKQLIIAD